MHLSVRKRRPTDLPMKIRRRQSDARWRANVANCYETLKHIIPINKRASKRQISKATVLQETHKHIDFLENILSSLLTEKAHLDGVDSPDVYCKQKVEDIKQEFLEKQRIRIYTQTQEKRHKRNRSQPLDDQLDEQLEVQLAVDSIQPVSEATSTTEVPMYDQHDHNRQDLPPARRTIMADSPATPSRDVLSRLVDGSSQEEDKENMANIITVNALPTKSNKLSQDWQDFGTRPAVMDHTSPKVLLANSSGDFMSTYSQAQRVPLLDRQQAGLTPMKQSSPILKWTPGKMTSWSSMATTPMFQRRSSLSGADLLCEEAMWLSDDEFDDSIDDPIHDQILFKNSSKRNQITPAATERYERQRAGKQSPESDRKRKQGCSTRGMLVTSLAHSNVSYMKPFKRKKKSHPKCRRSLDEGFGCYPSDSGRKAGLKLVHEPEKSDHVVPVVNKSATAADDMPAPGVPPIRVAGDACVPVNEVQFDHASLVLKETSRPPAMGYFSTQQSETVYKKWEELDEGERKTVMELIRTEKNYQIDQDNHTEPETSGKAATINQHRECGEPPPKYVTEIRFEIPESAQTTACPKVKQEQPLSTENVKQEPADFWLENFDMELGASEEFGPSVVTDSLQMKTEPPDEDQLTLIYTSTPRRGDRSASNGDCQLTPIHTVSTPPCPDQPISSSVPQPDPEQMPAPQRSASETASQQRGTTPRRGPQSSSARVLAKGSGSGDKPPAYKVIPINIHTSKSTSLVIETEDGHVVLDESIVKNPILIIGKDVYVSKNV